uniref:Secreted protein n=1 Tax=Steinernema glaseri TaxID=37863 RepID=A0A1I8AAG3_9BILA
MHLLPLLILVVFVHYGELVRYSLVPFAVKLFDGSTALGEVSKRTMCAQHTLHNRKIAYTVVKKANGYFDCTVYSKVQGFAKNTNPELEVFLLDTRVSLSCQEQSWNEDYFNGESSRREEGHRSALVVSFFTGPRLIEDTLLQEQLKELKFSCVANVRRPSCVGPTYAATVVPELSGCLYAGREHPFQIALARFTKFSNGSYTLEGRSPFHEERRFDVEVPITFHQVSTFDYSTTTHVLLHVKGVKDDLFIQKIKITTATRTIVLSVSPALQPNSDCCSDTYVYKWLSTTACPEYTKGAPYMVFGPNGPEGLYNKEHMEQLENGQAVQMHKLCRQPCP